jgi:FKBP-type peptidyl-prolyl cis-trans isomerase
LLARYTSPGFAIVLAFALAAFAFACGSSSKTTPTPGPTVDTSAQPTNVPIPTVSVTPTVTNDGLQIFDILAGTGQDAQAGDIAYVKYREWLEDATTVDDTFGAPVRETLRKGEIIDGLIEGITGMKVGGKRRLIIPPALGHGDKWIGNTIPPNSTLIYDIELTDIHRP